MTAIVILVVGVCLAFFAINFRTKLSTYPLLVYMFVVFTFCNAANPDIEIYQWRYSAGIYHQAVLFDFIMKGVKALGGSFVVYKAVVAIFVLSFSYYIIKNTTTYVAVVLALFVIFPFFETISQLKNGMMMVIAMYAIVTLLQDQKHGVVRYVVIILIASLFHPVALYYLSFLLAKTDYKRKKKRTIVIIFLAIMLVELCIEYNLLYELVKQFISNEKYLVYFDYKNIIENTTEEVLNWKGKLLPVVLHTAGYIIFRTVYKDFRKNLLADNCCEVYVDISDGRKKLCYFNVHQLDMINTMFFMTFTMIPLYMLNPTYFRVFKNIMLLMYIVLAQYLSYMKNTRRYIRRVRQRKNLVILYALMVEFMSVYSQGYFIEMLNSFSIF